MQEALFQLLRFGLRTSSPDEEDLSQLKSLSQKEWEDLFETSAFQGVSGVALDGLNALLSFCGKDDFNYFEDKSFWRRFISQWGASVVLTCEAGNTKQLGVVKVIQEKWGVEGIRTMIMKGAAIGAYYPEPLHRQPGDIDCYLFEDYAKGNEIAKDFADKVDEHWYKHSQISYRDEVIENHQFFVHTREGRISKELNRNLVDCLKDTTFEELPGTDALLPPTMFNAIFLAYHGLTHFLEEGIRLKQILDWAVFLLKDADKLAWPEFYEACDKYHLRRFVDVTTDIAVNLLGVKLDNPIITTDSPYTRKFLDSVFNDKDFVFSSGESGWKNRWHIVRNLFKYQWKYHQIYQHTILRQLWYFATGYFFETE